jgi:hypothetical protein
VTTGSPLALWLGVAALLGAATVSAVTASLLPLLASTADARPRPDAPGC